MESGVWWPSSRVADPRARGPGFKSCLLLFIIIWQMYFLPFVIKYPRCLNMRIKVDLGVYILINQPNKILEKAIQTMDANL